MDMFEVEAVTLTDAMGNEREYVVSKEFTFNASTYAVLVPFDLESDDAEEGIMMRCGTDENGDYLEDIEDDIEWDNAVAEYKRLIDEQDEQDEE